MNIRKIIKEEVSDFDWANDIPSARLNRYHVSYRAEVFIDAETEEQANQIYEGLNLGALRDEIIEDDDEVGLKEYSWVQTHGIEQVDND